MNNKLTPAEFLDNFERSHWRSKVTATLVEVADAPDATVQQRADAVKALCMLANDNLIPTSLPDGRSIPQVVASTCLGSLAGAPSLALDQPAALEVARANYAQRLDAVMFTLANVGPILPELQEKMGARLGLVVTGESN